MDTPGTAPQKTPHGNGPNIADLVKEDIELRANIGAIKYGEKLKPFNGRNSLWDAYQEVLDLAVYLRQRIYEDDNAETTPEQRRSL